MSWHKFVTFTCDSCGEVHDTLSTSVRDARRSAWAAGWSHRDGRDRCGACNGTHYRDAFGGVHRLTGGVQ